MASRHPTAATPRTTDTAPVRSCGACAPEPRLHTYGYIRPFTLRPRALYESTLPYRKRGTMLFKSGARVGCCLCLAGAFVLAWGCAGDSNLTPADGARRGDGSSNTRDGSGDGNGIDAGNDMDGTGMDDAATDAIGDGARGEICGNGIDDNGNGQVDEGCSCLPGATQRCFPGPAVNAGVGQCTFGMQRCAGTGEFGMWSMCAGATLPSGELCDGLDNDCDGVVDNGCNCRSGATRACYSGPMGTRGIGICRDGTQRCEPGAGGIGTNWGPCTGETLPGTESCDGIDNDCNGTTDDGCSCTPGASRSCYGGPAGSAGVGPCRAGTQTCTTSSGMSSWAMCMGQVLPGAELCDGIDNNCDGTIDEGCECMAGATRACYDGPAGTRGVGTCADGMQTCVAGPGGVGTTWGPCMGSRTPTAEVCDDLDNNCNGAADETCVCRVPAMRMCYTGPVGSAGTGICRAGSQSCVIASGVATWAMCTGEVLPGTEVCDTIDNNCDGMIDEGCACRSGESRTCYGGPVGTSGVGVCRSGTQACAVVGGTPAWGTCAGDVLPGAETCDGVDNNCDGVVDEGCLCPAGAIRSCYPGPAGTEGVGICRAGMQACTAGAGGVGTSWGACGGFTLPGTETCNMLDDDCDGMIDEGCSCTAGASRGCYGGPVGTSGVGICRSGNQTCSVVGGIASWGACVGDVLPGSEACDGIDNDCDGVVDNGCVCTAGTMRGCYPGPAGTAGVGICRAGSQTCVAGAGGVGTSWGACSGAVLPGVETCNSIDDNCNGVIDEGCSCRSGDMRACYGGPAGTAGIGVCRPGAQSCVVAGGMASWGGCSGETGPGAELCDGLDNDCDGVVDNGCLCTAGAARSCYPGPAGTENVGICRSGNQTCVAGAGGVGTSWGSCGGYILPGSETCNSIDDDCDGMIDEGCMCTTGSMRSCYGGPAGTSGVGVCRSGTQTCSVVGGVASWGTCTGDVLPSAELCDGLDNDCDGVVDDGCLCPPGSSRSCYSGPAGTAGVGTCRAGTQMCVSGAGGVGSSWGACGGQVLPAAEVCDAMDNDCNGIVDNGCGCTPGSSQSCYTGPAGTLGVGVCRAGSQSCVSGPGGVGSSWGACAGDVRPSPETCNLLDDNCNGPVDDGIVCGPMVTCPAPVTVRAGTTVMLCATAVGGITYAWTVTSAPMGSTYMLGSPSSACTTFTSTIVGIFTLQFTATDAAGRTASCTTTVTMQPFGFRVEMFWDTAGTDIDLHVHNSLAAAWFNTPNDCYFANRTPNWDNVASVLDDPSLDIDDVDGLGPENTRVDTPPTTQLYSVGVHYWRGMPNTNVTVRIYCGNTMAPIATYTRLMRSASVASDDPNNDFWRVARVQFTSATMCTITPVNDIITGAASRAGSP